MSKDINQRFVIEAVRMELNISFMFKLFASMFEKDESFWLNMSEVKQVHARMIRLLEKRFINELKHCINTPNVERINRFNKEIEAYSRQVEFDTLSRNQAFDFALKVEHHVYETMFRATLLKMSKSESLDIFALVFKKESQRKNNFLRYLKENKI